MNTAPTSPSPKFKVVRVYRNSACRKILHTNLTESQAQKITMRYPTTEKSMVSYFRQ